MNEGEIVLYQPDENMRLEVRVVAETVWLTQLQMQQLFDSSKANISEHIANIYEQGELVPESTVRNFRTVRIEGGRKVNRNLEYYNLDMIISVGYRVKSVVGVRFRQWATSVLKQHLLQGYTVNHQLVALQERMDCRFNSLEQRVDKQEEQVAFLVRTHQEPTYQLYNNGCVFDAWAYVSDLVRKATQRIILIDNYVDDRVLSIMQKRAEGVVCTIHTRYTEQFQTDLKKHNEQYPEIKYVQLPHRKHDRYLIVDGLAYMLGDSLKNMGGSLTAIIRTEMTPDEVLGKLD